MTIRDLPHIQQLQAEMDKMALLLQFNAMLGGALVPEPTASETAAKLAELKRNADDLVAILERFNSDFSSTGWIVHDTLDPSVARRASEILSTEGRDGAESFLVQSYSPDYVRKMSVFFNGAPELRRRIRFIQYALEEYDHARFIGCIPLLLIVIDGAVNESARSGMHSEDLQLDAWDSLVSVEDGIPQLHRIFTAGRYKTREEQINVPYRNGILHGMDLGYDNLAVAAKCWHFLFVVRDWLNARRTEDTRKQKRTSDAEVDLTTLGNRMARTARVRDIIAAWTPRQITQTYLSSLADAPLPVATPEGAALEFLSYWRRKNYGFMDKMQWRRLRDGASVQDIRRRYGGLSLTSYTVDSIEDEAPVICNVSATVDIHEKGRRRYRVRLVYARDDDELTVPELGDGRWSVVVCTEA